MLEVFKISLEVLDFEIDAISDSGKALALVSEKDYDLVFLDLKMQPIDGMQILKEIKKLKPDTTAKQYKTVPLPRATRDGQAYGKN